MKFTTSHPDDIPWNGEISSKPTPCSEMTDVGYVFHDITWKQKVRNLGTFLPLNLIGRTQERLQVARLLQALLLNTDPKRILSIQVDAVYVQLPKSEAKKMEHKFKNLKYCDLNEIVSPLPRSLTNMKSARSGEGTKTKRAAERGTAATSTSASSSASASSTATSTSASTTATSTTTVTLTFALGRENSKLFCTLQ